MGHIPEDVIDEVRARADLATVIGQYVDLEKRGADYWCCCPFHKEKTASFKLSPAHGTYHCFGCGVSGNVFKFVMEMENVDFPAAIRLLAKQTGVHIPEELVAGRQQPGHKREITKDGVLEVLGKAAEWFRQQLATGAGSAAREYLAGRGIDRDTIARFGLGYAPDSWDALHNWGRRQGYSDGILVAAGLLSEKEGEGGEARLYDRFRDRVIFPIWDELGRVAGFSGRLLDPNAKSAKYLNTPETIAFHKGRLLYCLNIARKSFKESEHALVCEGQLDVIACHRAGLTQAVAPQGTAFTEEQARLLRRHTKNVVFAFDADAAGVKAAVRSIEVAIKADLKAKVVAMPEGEDPDGIFRGGGAKALTDVMSNSRDAFEFLFSTTAVGEDLTTPQGKQAVVGKILDVVNLVPHPVAKAGLCQWLAGKLSVPEKSVFEALTQLNRRRKRTESFRRRVPIDDQKRGSSGKQMTHPTQESSHPKTAVEVAVENLFDLAIHHETVARQLVTSEHLTPETLGSGTMERALMLILQKTVEDEWYKAAQAIGADYELSADSGVVRLMHGSTFPNPDEEELPESKRKQRKRAIEVAVRNCLDRIERDHLEQHEQRLSEGLQKSDPTETVRLMTDLVSLRQRKRDLHPAAITRSTPRAASTANPT